MRQLLAPTGTFCLVSHNPAGSLLPGGGGGTRQRPEWLQAVISGLGCEEGQGDGPRWLLEIHLPAADQRAKGGPTVYLFRKVQRPSRGSRGGAGAGGGSHSLVGSTNAVQRRTQGSRRRPPIFRNRRDASTRGRCPCALFRAHLPDTFWATLSACCVSIPYKYQHKRRQQIARMWRVLMPCAEAAAHRLLLQLGVLWGNAGQTAGQMRKAALGAKAGPSSWLVG
eukprot:SAG22_NODE_3971_length_1444_cov_5.805204_2_plen_224_part_00